jgi:hypothetical protein
MTSASSPKPRRTRAVDLLIKVVETGSFDPAELAHELAITPATLDRYVSGAVAIPLERQLCLALFVIEKIPPLSRAGHMLRGQVRAAIAFQQQATKVHQTAPLPGPRSY